MRLTQLEPRFLRRESPTSFRYVETLAEADGVLFLCPKCFQENSGQVGTHGVICWSPFVPQDTQPTPGRWGMSGSSFEDLSLSPSVQLLSGCSWHGYVTGGEVSII